MARLYSHGFSKLNKTLQVIFSVSLKIAQNNSGADDWTISWQLLSIYFLVKQLAGGWAPFRCDLITQMHNELCSGKLRVQYNTTRHLNTSLGTPIPYTTGLTILFTFFGIDQVVVYYFTLSSNKTITFASWKRRFNFASC